MPIQYTEEQQRVIDTHGRNILVSAAAGSGKTAVLAERIVRMVCDETRPVDIDRLLIVTFTNAAAAEMRERISAGIIDRLNESPDSIHIQRQAVLIHNAQITTIDSFSLFIVRNHFHEIGLDPAFRVADEGERKLLEQDVLSELLEEKFARKEEGFLGCVEYFCPGGKEQVLEKHILNLAGYASGFPWPQDWLRERKEDYSAESIAELLASDYGCYLFRYIGKILEDCVEKLDMAAHICMEPDGPYMYAGLVEEEREGIAGLKDLCPAGESGDGLSEETARALMERLCGFSFGRLPSKKDDVVSVTKREIVKKLRNDVKDAMKEIADRYFSTPLELSVAQGKASGSYVSELIDLVLEFEKRMQEKKRERKIISFSDMEHFCLDILLKHEKRGDQDVVIPTAVAKEYRQYFAEVLIDEYQDSNLVQEYILRAVSGEEDGNFNRFMVGDVKQSIYKFRLARPELFMEKYETYKDEGERIRIDLSKNFRSRTQVIDSVNGIFSAVMHRQTGGIEYDHRAALYAGAAYTESGQCKSELILIDKGEGAEDAKETEARAIAWKIKELKENFRVTDRADGSLKDVRYSDIVILLRTNAGWDETFKRILEDEGIPVYITSKTGYFSAVEVQELLQLLRVLDNPYQDIPLFGSMKSIFGGFDDNEIAMVRSENPGLSMYEALCAITAREGWEEEQALYEKCCSFLEHIRIYRELTVYLPIRDLLQRIVEDYQYLDYVTALPAGSRRRANVEMLFTKASDFEKTSYFGLFHFVRYIEQLEKYDVDFGEADTLDENADVVRIMSIHKSKGLEFPVVFVAGMSKRFNMQDANQSVIVDMDLGIGCDYIDLEKRVRNKTLRKTVISAKMREENLAEELRVLYVALTRAREKLLMTGTLESPEEKLEMIRALKTDRLSYTDFIHAGNYLDFVLPFAEQAEVEVSIQSLESIDASSATEQIGMMEKRQKLLHSERLCNQEKLEYLISRFRFAYPYEGMAKLYTKTTVSELKIAAMADKDEAAYHTFEEREVIPFIPSFCSTEEKVSGTVRGSAFHRAMELLDFEELLGGFFKKFPEDYDCYKAGIDRKILAGRLHQFLLGERESLRLSQEYLDALNEGKIVNFLSKELAYRMWRADREGNLYREQPFVLGIEAERLITNEDIPKGEKVLIQGIIDVFFMENEKVILLDYKTDVIHSMEALQMRYETQLDYYAEALEKLTGLPVMEKLLYSFYLETDR